ncbi:MAG: ABC transporter permease subunit [Candidatus Lindowbacteria bacterium]|nr:ABC transporter permease subunit [Candidatus Lindowbacteria bacterium]
MTPLTSALVVSSKVTALAALIIFLAGLPLGYFFARSRSKFKFVAEILVLLPLLLPPTVLAWALLNFLGPNGFLGFFGMNLLFTLPGAGLAAGIAGLPLMVLATRAAVSGVDPTLENAARTLGSSEWEVFSQITLPLAKKGVSAGMLLGIGRAIGEFGATLMVAGSIPGKTRTLSLLLYEAVQLGQDQVALSAVLILTALSALIIGVIRLLENGSGPK